MGGNKSSGVSELSSAQRILERTIEVIEQSGEASVRTNPIAFECGVTPPILYRAYESREGLIIAAQAERYRRSTEEAVTFLCDTISRAESRDDLKSRVLGMLNMIFVPERVKNRRLRVEVIGSSVSRPALRKQIASIDRDYAVSIAAAYQPAIERGWVAKEKNMEAIALWAQGLVNTRYMIDATATPEDAMAWNELTCRAIINVIFD